MFRSRYNRGRRSFSRGRRSFSRGRRSFSRGRRRFGSRLGRMLRRRAPRPIYRGARY